MAEQTFTQTLNEQVASEFAASQQYIAIAVYYDGETLPQLASFFYRQAIEERNHALMIVQYLLDSGAEALRIPGIDPPQSEFGDIVAPVSLALEQEKRVSAQFAALAAAARDQGDYQGEQFLQWFIKEQVEEVSTMSDLLKIVERAKENPLLAEEYLVREQPGDAGQDPTAPPAAGGAL